MVINKQKAILRPMNGDGRIVREGSDEGFCLAVIISGALD